TWGKLLSQFAIDLIEQPEYRLAGAEEAIRQMIVTVEQVLQHYEPLSKELASRTSDATEKVSSGLTAIKNTAPTGRKLASMVTAVAALVQVYPKWRLQSLILRRVVGVYISLRGSLSDQLRELNFCRGRLEELRRTLDCPEPESFL